MSMRPGPAAPRRWPAPSRRGRRCPPPLPEPTARGRCATASWRRRALPGAALGDHPRAAAGAGGVRLALDRGLRAGGRCHRVHPGVCKSVAVVLRHVPAAPAGRHEICVCTNIACALVGAGDTLREFERELGIHAGETTADGLFTLRTVECYGGCGWGPVVSVDERYHEPFPPDRVDGSCWPSCGRGRMSAPAQDPARLRGRPPRRPRLRAGGRLRPLRAALGDGAGRRRGDRGRLRPARPRRGRLPHRPQGLVPAQGPQARVPVRERRRVASRAPSRTARLMLRNPHALIEGVLTMSYAIGATSAFIYIRGEYRTEFEVLKLALEQAHEPGLDRQQRARARATTPPSSCTAAPAPTSAARRRRCSARSRASAASRGRSRRSPRSRGLYAAPTLVNNVETLCVGALHPGDGRRGLQGDRHRALERHARVLALGQRPPARQLRAAADRTRCATWSRAAAAAPPRGRTIKAIIPGGSSTPLLMPDQLDTKLDFEAIAAAGSMAGSGAVIVIDDRICMVQLALRVAQFYKHESCGKCTPCREGTSWGVEIIEDRDGRGQAGRARPAAERVRPDPGQVPVPARRLDWRCRSSATSPTSARSSSATSTRAAARSPSPARSRRSTTDQGGGIPV